MFRKQRQEKTARRNSDASKSAGKAVVRRGSDVTAPTTPIQFDEWKKHGTEKKETKTETTVIIPEATSGASETIKVKDPFDLSDLYQDPVIQVSMNKIFVLRTFSGPGYCGNRR